jgi:hypothetical protein
MQAFDGWINLKALLQETATPKLMTVLSRQMSGSQRKISDLETSQNSKKAHPYKYMLYSYQNITSVL